MAEAETQEAVEEQVDQAAEGAVEVQEAELPEVSSQPVGDGNGQIDILLDSPMSVQVQLGETELLVREMLQLAPGSVLKLDRRAGEPLDVFLQGVKFATGQLVVVGDSLGVRIKEILSQDTENAGEQA